MIKRLVHHFTGKIVKADNGDEFESSYYYLELENGKKILVNGATKESRKLMSLVAEIER